ncbi:MAG: hypothetical protein WCC84_07195 [Candidatus Cybelea sp.]
MKDRATHHRVTFSLSEALRLTNLPGEDQGRVYYFRRVLLGGVPADGNRNVWLARMRQVLMELAGAAVHGAGARAGEAEAIFFYNHEEGLEALLRRVLDRAIAPEWFWPLVSGADSSANRAEQIAAIVERLRELPGSWTRVAQVLFAGLGAQRIVELAAAIPVAEVRLWLRELGNDGLSSTGVAEVGLTVETRTALIAAVQRFGRADPRTLWLASLAVIQSVAAALAAGTAVARARTTLERLVLPRYVEPLRIEESFAGSDVAAAAIQFDEGPVSDDTVTKWPVPVETTEPGGVRIHETHDPYEVRSRERPDVRKTAALDERSVDYGATIGEDSVGERPPELDSQSVNDTPPDAEVRSESAGEFASVQLTARGAPTEAAGLFFLLNALRYLGIGRALESDPALADAGLAVRVLEHLAAHAQIDPTDPMLPWLNLEIARSEEVYAVVHPSADAWPKIFGPSRHADPDCGYFVRAWSLAVRRWCRRAGGLTVREVINRRGYVALSRTDIDVTLPLDGADVRIRRIGLDIDPGWLPWLGRVVRFHYASAQAGSPPC